MLSTVVALVALFCFACGQQSTCGSGSPAPDTNNNCCNWARQGECDRNPFFMRVQCQTSCGTAGATVVNALTCQTRVSTNCQGAGGNTGSNTGSNTGAITSNNNVNAQACATATDTDPVRCAKWAQEGKCKQFLRSFACKKSCCSASSPSLQPSNLGVNPLLAADVPRTQQQTACIDADLVFCPQLVKEGKCSSQFIKTKECRKSCGAC